MNGLGFKLLEVSLVSFLLIALFFFSYFGVLPLYMGWDEYRASVGVTDKDTIFYMLLYSSIAIVFVLFGASFAKLFQVRRNLLHYSFWKPNRAQVGILFLLMLFSVHILYIYYTKVGSFAIFVAIDEGVHQASKARSMMGNNFSGKYHWYSLIMHDLLNMISFGFYAFYLVYKRIIYLLLFVTSFILSSITALMAIEKGPFAFYLMGLFLVVVILKHNGRYPIKKMFAFFGVLLSFLIASYINFMGAEDFSGALTSIISRAFAGSVEPAYHYLKFFPHHQDFILGRSFPNPGGFLEFEPYRLTVEVNNWVHPDLSSLGIVGSMPTVFWGEAYANFGFLGIPVIAFLVGILVQTIDYLFSFFSDSPVKVGFYVWMLLHYKDLAITGFTGFIIDFYLIFVFLFFLLIIAFSDGMKIKIKRCQPS